MTSDDTVKLFDSDQARAKLFSALSKAQKEMNNPAQDGTNPHFRSKYTTLAKLRDAVVPVLAKHGLSMTQDATTEIRGDKLYAAVHTHLHHGEGGFVSYGPTLVPVDKPNAHGVGSAITYARRYSMQSVAGVAGDDDDDGNDAVGDGGSAQSRSKGRFRGNSSPNRDDELIRAYEGEVKQAASEGELWAIAGNWKDRIPSRLKDRANEVFQVRQRELATAEARA